MTVRFWPILPFVTGSNRPIVLNKLIIQNCVTIDHRERHFCTLLHGIRVWKPLPKLKISISDAYFSAVETMADFFNGIGQLQSFVEDHNWLVMD